jgi:hypothetical protein
MPQSNSEAGIFTGATATASGTNGLVPRPVAGQNDRFMCANGEWVKVANFTISQGGGGLINRTTNGPLVQPEETTTNKINFDGMAFDPVTTQYAQFWDFLPPSYNGGPVFAVVVWKSATGEGTVIFTVRARAYADGEAIDQALGTHGTTTDTYIGAEAIHYSPPTPAITIAGNPEPGHWTCLEVYRTAGTLAVNAVVLGVKIYYTPLL